MKILFYGDSITDMGRNREFPRKHAFSMGVGYPFVLQSKLGEKDPTEYTCINNGVSGNRIVDLYARVKCDVWNEEPDVLSILIGANDVWHEIDNKNGVEEDRFEKVYSMLIEDTLKRLPNLKIILLEPFVLEGEATAERMDKFNAIKDYAKIVKNIAERYNLAFVPLQKKFDEVAEKYGAEVYLIDGIHPTVAGSTLIANEWLKVFEKIEK